MDGRAAGDHAGQAGQAGNARQARQAPVHRADRYTGQAGQAATGRPRQRGVENGSGTASEESGLDLLLALSAVPTAVLGRNGDIVDVNDAFRVWSGHSTEQLAGMRIHDLLDSSEHAGLDHDLERVGRPGSASGRVRAERAVVPATGRRIWAIVDLVAMPTAGGPPGLVSQWLDVTELSDHEERQRQRALEDGELASFVSALVRADDPEAVLTEAAARVAAVIGDACAVFRAEGATRLREFTWQSRRPDALDPDRPLTVDFSAGTRSGPLAKVLRSGRRVSELAADVAALRAQLPAQFRRPLDLLGVSSAVFVPVRVLGAVAGV
ncbi:MAG: PAS domain S-box protein, partial [Frankiaceae bacterium]